MFWKSLLHPKQKASRIEPVSGKPADAELTGLFEEILNRGSYLRVEVTGKSMAPVLRSGDIVTIVKVTPASLRVGDLVFYKNGLGLPVLHRLLTHLCSLKLRCSV